MSLDRNEIVVWAKGLIGAGISGAATSISSGIGASMLAPDKFNLETGMSSLLKLIAITATVSFIVSISKYLSIKPIPEDLNEDAK